MAKTKLKISDMSCQHCVKTVTEALTALEGVQRAKVNLRKGEAVVRFDASRITTINLIEAVTKAGFEAVKKTEPLSLGLIGGILILLFSIVRLFRHALYGLNADSRRCRPIFDLNRWRYFLSSERA